MKGVPQTQAEVDLHNERVRQGRARRNAAGVPAGDQVPDVSGHPPKRQIGVQRAIREEDVAEKVIEEAKRRGWICIRSNPTAKTGRLPGEPDLEVWADGGRTFHVELKRPVGGKLSTEQLGVIAWGRRLGHVVHVVTSLEEFLHVVDTPCTEPVHLTPQHRRD